MAINYAKYVSELVQRARAAQEVANSYTQERVDELCAAIAYNTTQPDFARKLAESLVEESGMGDVENKIAKIYTKVKGGYRDMKGQKSVGLIHEDKEKALRPTRSPWALSDYHASNQRRSNSYLQSYICN